MASVPSTEQLIAERQERELSELGFIPIMRSPNTDLCIFYSNQSLYAPPRYDKEIANVNARLSTMLQYTLCVSRFAHYLKVIGRDRVGTFTTAAECEAFLARWLREFTVENVDDNAELRARHPLRESRVQVREIVGKPGNYYCEFHLQPQFQLDQVTSSFRLITELAPVRPG